MDVQCFPISTLPGTTVLLRDFAEPHSSLHAADLSRWYPAEPFGMGWAARSPQLSEEHRSRLANLLREQSAKNHASEAVFANIDRLQGGAAAVVTGQQVGLFGGPLLTLLKAATAIRKAQDATTATGREHVPVFWLATEDHDVDEVDTIALLSKTAVEHNGANVRLGAAPVPVGTLRTGEHIESALAWAEELLAYAPITEVLREAYTDHEGYEATMSSGFARLLSHIFAAHGLIVVDAASRGFHQLGAPALRYAIEHADELEAALIARSKELEAAGYHAQVKVAPGMSLLFLITRDENGIPIRQALRRASNGAAEDVWKAGLRTYTTAELLAILDAEPERLSPNALLRPVFQDAIFPTAAYIGGPAEIAYFAQSAVVYEQTLGRITPILPRLSATLIEPAIAKVMAAHEVQLPQVWEAQTADALAQRLGARAMPIESKRKLAAVGNAMDAELTALTEYMSAMSEDLGRAANVSASKMRYQMGRLRRMAANFELQKQASLKKHADAIMLNLYPEAHLQERLLGGIWFLARYGETLPALLVEHAAQECPGHRVFYL